MENERAASLGIAELAELAGVTPRTIRYYVAEGLLPPPGGAGQQRAYTPEHLLRLKAIRRLKEAYLPLEEIRRRLAALSPAELEYLASAPATPAPSSALDYLAAVLSSPPTHGQGEPLPVAAPAGAQSVALPAPAAAPTPAESTPPPPVAPAQSTPLPATEAAPDQSVHPPESARLRKAPSSAVPVGAPDPPVLPTGAAGEPGPFPSVPAPDAPTARRAAESAGEENSPAGAPWHRVTLAPGVELQYQRRGDAQRDAVIARLIDEATRLLSSLLPTRDVHR